MKIEVVKDRVEIAKIITNVSKLWCECKVMKAPAYEMADAILLYFIEKEAKRILKEGKKYGVKDGLH